MAAILVYRSGPDEGRKCRLTGGIIRLGRKPDNDLVLNANMVSGYHAELRIEGESFLLVDLDSTNGTYVNGKKIHEVRLRSGDRIEVGENGPELEFRDDSARHSDAPRIVPISGSWDGGDEPIELAKRECRIGRNTDNDIVVGRTHGSVVSGEHAVIHVHSDHCEIEDLGSSNGSYVNAHRVDRARLHGGDRIEFGEGGPTCRFEWRAERAAHHGRHGTAELMYHKLERAAKGGPVGDRTMMIYQLAQKYYKRRRRPYVIVISLAILVALIALGGVYVLWNRLDRVNNLNKFYQVRLLNADLVGKAGLTDAEKKSLRARRITLEDEYEKYLVKVGWYANKSPQEQEVMRLARRLGEADLEIPDGFFQIVKQYVDKWRSTTRLRTALERARSRKLLPMIRSWLLQKELPAELLFIALEESDFDSTKVGPATRFGVAKGMWQLIPDTAKEYRLTLGPWINETKMDPSDDRHHELRSTIAATDYLAYLYSTKAAASGLLVIASYNYGQTRIIKKLDTLPNNPRERNFWNFYRNGWLPDDTKEYVFYIFSAALICEKPEVFGFDMRPITTEW